jgi:hypothetical protein
VMRIRRSRVDSMAWHRAPRVAQPAGLVRNGVVKAAVEWCGRRPVIDPDLVGLQIWSDGWQAPGAGGYVSAVLR